MKRKNDFQPNPSSSSGKNNSNKGSYIGDPKLVSRVRQYLENNKKKTVISVNLMAEELQNAFPEYARKKKSAFRNSVTRAFHIVKKDIKAAKTNKDKAEYSKEEAAYLERKRHKTDEAGIESESTSGSSSDSFSSDNEEYVMHQDSNRMNSLVTNLYQSTPNSSQPNSRAPSAPASPARPMNEDDDLFIIDRVGSSSKKGAPKKKKKASTAGDSSLQKKNEAHFEEGKYALCPRCQGLSKNYSVCDMCFLQLPNPPSFQYTNIDITGDPPDEINPSQTQAKTRPPPAEASQPSEGSQKGDDVLILSSDDEGSHDEEAPLIHDPPSLAQLNPVALLPNPPLMLPSLPVQPVIIEPRPFPRSPLPANRPTSSVPSKHPTTIRVQSAICISDSPGPQKSGEEMRTADYESRKEQSKGKKDDRKKRKGVESRRGSQESAKGSAASSSKGNKKGPQVTQSAVKFADLGGIDGTLKDVCKLLIHMKHPEVYEKLGVTPPRGFLLHGPPGCGKTLLAHAIAGELELPFIKLAATEIVSGVSGESEEKLRSVFETAVTSAPCILFLDEIDAITPKRETASKDMERRIVSQLLSCMDDLSSKSSSHVLVIGATNRPDSIDPALRRAGRFDREISMGIPNESARQRILEVLCRLLRVTSDFDFPKLAQMTPGYVGADLMALVREAAITAVNRAFSDLQAEALLKQSKASDSKEVSSEEVIDLDEADSSKDKADEADKQAEESETPVSPKAAVNEDPHKSGEESQMDISVNEESKAEEASKDSSCGGKQQESATVEVVHPQLDEFQSVLSWLKEAPPLSDYQLENLFITMPDFEVALKHVQPSAKREGFATVPDVTWDDIGALHNVRDELQMAILAPVRHREQFKSLGLTNPPGILLAGPPGCGKTLLAKAIANESGVNFISVKGPELLNMYVGESERAVRQVFQRARNSSPCVIFFDELDALCPRRSEGSEGGASVRVVNQLLTEMDGLEERRNVFIMGATNRPDIIDPAVLRPGRLDKTLYVGLPSPSDRLDILNTITKNGTKPILGADVNLEEVANNDACSCFTGADIAALVREASVSALREFLASPEGSSDKVITVYQRHFERAFQKVKPSVTQKDQNIYEKMKSRFQV